MPNQNQPNSENAHPLVYAGIILVAAPLCMAAFTPQLPIIVAIPLGIALGVPCLIWGMRSQRPSSSEVAGSKPFLPSSKESWAIVGLFTMILVMFAPLSIILPLILYLPAGDNWGKVALRLSAVGASIAGYYGWIHFAAKTFPELFRGKISDELLNSFKYTPPPPAQSSVKETALKQWQLLAIAIVAFVLFWGLINLNHPFLQPIPAPRRARQLVNVIAWCRGNPNTARSSALLVGIGALALYAQRLRQAYVRDSSASADPQQTKEGDEAMSARGGMES